MNLSRRLVLKGLLSASVAWHLRTSNVTAGAAPDPGRDSDHPYLPNATFGYAVHASNINAESLLTEPISMFFSIYGFGSEADAKEAFPEVLTYLKGQADKVAAAAEGDMEHNRISIGQLGDEREAYYAEPFDSARHLLIVVRVGENILNVRAMALGGSTDEFVAGYLETFLAGATEDPMSLVPDISDLPVGWELDEPVWAGELLDIITTPAGSH